MFFLFHILLLKIDLLEYIGYSDNCFFSPFSKIVSISPPFKIHTISFPFSLENKQEKID